jgi:hypothetical protein
VEKKMETTVSRKNDHLLLWLAAILMLFGVGLGDVGIVALNASIVSSLQLLGFALSFTLIGVGALFSVWQIRR